MACHFGGFWFRICGNSISELEVASFRFFWATGRIQIWWIRSSEDSDPHGLLKFRPPRNPYSWFWIYQISLKHLRKSKHIYRKIFFGGILTSQHVKDVEKTRANKPDELSNKLLIISNMGPICSRKEELEIIPNTSESWNLEALTFWTFEKCITE